MKKIKLLFCALVVTSISLTSCSDDDSASNNDPIQNVSIEGKWFYAKEGIASNGQEILHDWEHTEGCSKDYIELLDNDVFRDVSFWDDCDQDIDTDTWARSGNTVTIGTGPDAMVMQIRELNSNILKASWAETVGGQEINYVTIFTRN